MDNNRKDFKYRSQAWFDNKNDPGMTALYLERYLNYGISRTELQSARPIIGIAQTGNDLSPCNRHHLLLAERLRDGIRDAGGIPMEFPTHPIQETGRRPTAALDRNLSYLSMVETIYGYPIDGVIFTIGCDKTTPAALMAAGTLNIPSIAFSVGPMLNGYYKGKLCGSGTAIWEARKLYAQKKIGYGEFMDIATSSAPSVGYCNTMGTASSMNCLSEALGMSLPNSGTIPAPYRQRAQCAYETGLQIVKLVNEDIKPSNIMTKEAFINAIVVSSAIGASTNAPIHINAIAKNIGIEINNEHWQKHGYEIPLLLNCQPAGKYLGEDFYRAGGIGAIMHELINKNKINTSTLTVSGQTTGENYKNSKILNNKVIKPYDKPLLSNGGFLVMSGNLFDSAILKTSVIDDKFLNSFIQDGVIKGKAVVFEGPEDYHDRINNESLKIDKNSILFMRNCGPKGFPGSGEVINMLPPDKLIKKGITALPTIGDGRQSGTSASTSILNASPESVVGGGLALLKTGDTIIIDMNNRKVQMLIDDKEYEKRKRNFKEPLLENDTPWQEIYRKYVENLADGACLKLNKPYNKILDKKWFGRNSH
ncbi:MAG: dihydroxy-acid dehydratase family protein [Epsilonproteobacteria bacterium]|nr:dihydroxy-acid dehydratase family protein [Campylobacterota bacterium]